MAEVVKFLGGSAILLTVVGFLIRSLVAHYLSKDVETFKTKLALQALEHEIRFRRVDERVAEHLSGVYARLFPLYKAVHSFVKILERRDEPDKNAKFETVRQLNRDFWDYLLP
ncbi:MAG: hypothetical protein WED34_01140, partial [Planctomycetales bacterium]